MSLLVVAGVGSVYLSSAEASPTQTPSELVEPKPENNVIWPYTSRAQTPSERTLPINVIVYGDADDVRTFLTERIEASWNETEEEWEDVNPDEGPGVEANEENSTVVEWANARGATRYLYVHNFLLTEETMDPDARRPHRAPEFVPNQPTSASGQWVDEAYQLHDGNYFGSRDHVRVYESPYDSDEWVALQAHSEHWDWFRLRHTVDGVERTQSRIESAFMGEPLVDDVWRMYLGADSGSDANGWATVVELASIPGPAMPGHVGTGAVMFVLARRFSRSSAIAGERDGGRDDDRDGESCSVDQPLLGAGPSHFGIGHEREESWRTWWPPHDLEGIRQEYLLLVLRALTYGLLFVSVLALYLAVRVGGIVLEEHASSISPRRIWFGLYPIIAVGLPLCAYRFARTVGHVRSFVLSATGLGLAFVLDYASLNVSVLPLEVVLHRVGLVVAIGLIAAGATRRDGGLPPVDRWLAAGVLLWVFLLLAPLVGWM